MVIFFFLFQEAFNAFHNDISQVKKYLKPIHLGTVEKYEDSELNKDFRELKETVLKMVSTVNVLKFRTFFSFSSQKNVGFQGWNSENS